MQDFNSTFNSRSKFLGDRTKTGTGRIRGHLVTDQAIGHCRECGERVRMTTVAGAARAFKTDIQDICFLLNRAKIHPAHPDRLRAFICMRSLEDCFEQRDTRLLDSYFEMEAARAIAVDISK